MDQLMPYLPNQAMVNFSDENRVSPVSRKGLESHVRSALAFGTLSPEAEAEIQALVARGGLSPYENALLTVLWNGIQEGHICRGKAIADDRP